MTPEQIAYALRLAQRVQETGLSPGAELCRTLARALLAEHERAERLAGPGSPAARFERLLSELEQRVPDPDPFSAQAPEGRYVAAIDGLMKDAARWRAVCEIEAVATAIKLYVGYTLRIDYPATVDEAADRLIQEQEARDG